MSRFKVSFCVLTYNRAEYLRQSLGAMVAQTYEDIEIIISDNASTDNTADVVKSFNDSRIRYIVRETNLGDNGNYKKVIQESDADFLFITHDDDVVDVDYIERCMKKFNENEKLIALGTNVKIIDDVGRINIKSLYDKSADLLFAKNTYFFEYISTGLWIPPSTMGIRWSEQVKKLMRQQEEESNNNIGGNADVYLSCMLNTLGDILLIGDTLASYREHGDQMSMKDNFKKGAMTLLISLKDLYRKIGNKELIKAVEQAMYIAELQDILLSESDVIEAKVHELIKKIYKINPNVNKAWFLSLVAALYNCPIRFFNCELNYLHTKVERSLRGWIHMVDSNKDGPFEKVKKSNNQKIAILGSMSIAAVLAIHAKRIGLSVACFLDGNLSRQNHLLLGIKIFPHSWLNENHVDFVIVSSEKEKYNGIKEMLINNTSTKAKILCWKDEILNQL